MGNIEVTGIRIPFDMLAHEMLNPLTSLRGCALTLENSRDQLAPDVVTGLIQIVAKQAMRLEWLVRAARSNPSVPADDEGLYGIEEAVRDSASLVSSEVSIRKHPGSTFGSATRARLGFELIFIALADGGAETSAILDHDTLTIISPSADTEYFERNWKLELARDLLQSQGMVMSVHADTRETIITVGLPKGDRATSGVGEQNERVMEATHRG